MGVGMSVICAPKDVDAVRNALTAEGLETFAMGEIVAGTPGQEGKVIYR